VILVWGIVRVASSLIEPWTSCIGSAPVQMSGCGLHSAQSLLRDGCCGVLVVLC